MRGDGQLAQEDGGIRPGSFSFQYTFISFPSFSLCSFSSISLHFLKLTGSNLFCTVFLFEPFSNVFGQVCMCSDGFGGVPIHSDTF